MRYLFWFACSFFILVGDLPEVAAEKQTSSHVLKGRIIRSLTIEADNPHHILVGQKSNAPGSALIFQSLDGGKSWRTLNGNQSLAPKATDVQAVAVFSKTILLAGTWKHGLYISHDSGAGFTRIVDFPSDDIRDLQVIDGNIYAATAHHGIFKSSDKGASWQSSGSTKEFFWSISASPLHLFANSLAQGVYQWRAGIWVKIFDEDKAYASAVASNARAIAAETGLYLSTSKAWRKVLADEKFADVIFTKKSQLVAASWSNGIVILSQNGHLQQRLLTGKSVIHLQITKSHLLAGTWGDGLHTIPLSQISQIPVIVATLKNDISRVAELLDAGADPDTYDDNRNTALVYAARDGRTKIAALLIMAGASPSWVDGEKVTPLILAAHKNHIKIVRLLLAHKVSIKHRDKWGRTALDYAKRRGTDDPIYQLLKQ